MAHQLSSRRTNDTEVLLLPVLLLLLDEQLVVPVQHELFLITNEDKSETPHCARLYNTRQEKTIVKNPSPECINTFFQ